MWSKVSQIGASIRKPTSQLDLQLKEATGPENWGVPNSLLHNIALATHDINECDTVLTWCFDVLKERKDKFWRRIQKTLSLMEVLLKHGSDRCIEGIRRDLWRVQQWREHRVNEEGREVAGGIRAKANIIVDLCGDPAMLLQERDKAQHLTQKMTGHGTSPAGQKKDGGPNAFKSPFDRKKKHHHHQSGGGWDGSSPSSHGHSPGGCAARNPTESEKQTMVQQFCSVTSAGAFEARECLERHNWDAHAAVNSYLPESAARGVGGNRRREKPGWSELRTMVQQVVNVTKVTEQRANQLLEQSNWNVDAALEKVYQEEPRGVSGDSRNVGAVQSSRPNPPARGRSERSESSSSVSSSSSGSDSDVSPQRSHGGGKGDKDGWPNSKGAAFGGGGWGGGAPAWPNTGGNAGGTGASGFGTPSPWGAPNAGGSQQRSHSAGPSYTGGSVGFGGANDSGFGSRGFPSDGYGGKGKSGFGAGFPSAGSGFGGPPHDRGASGSGFGAPPPGSGASGFGAPPSGASGGSSGFGSFPGGGGGYGGSGGFGGPSQPGHGGNMPNACSVGSGGFGVPSQAGLGGNMPNACSGNTGGFGCGGGFGGARPSGGSNAFGGPPSQGGGSNAYGGPPSPGGSHGFGGSNAFGGPLPHGGGSNAFGGPPPQGGGSNAFGGPPPQSGGSNAFGGPQHPCGGSNAFGGPPPQAGGCHNNPFGGGGFGASAGAGFGAPANAVGGGGFAGW